MAYVPPNKRVKKLEKDEFPALAPAPKPNTWTKPSFAKLANEWGQTNTEVKKTYVEQDSKVIFRIEKKVEKAVEEKIEKPQLETEWETIDRRKEKKSSEVERKEEDFEEDDYAWEEEEV
jgi:ribosomal protein L24E